MTTKNGVREYWDVQISSFNCEHQHRAFETAQNCARKYLPRVYPDWKARGLEPDGFVSGHTYSV